MRLETERSQSGLFVVVRHMPDTVACLIPTTHTDRYEDDPGCVMYSAGQTAQFSQKTAILPEFRMSIAFQYAALLQADRNDRLQNLGVLPAEFESQFLEAIKHNATLSNAERRRWRSFLGIEE